MHSSPLRTALSIAPIAGLALTAGAQPDANPADADADGQITRAEFKAYLATRAPGLSQQASDRIVELVDKDQDGIISDAEFDDRMTSFRAVTSGEDRGAPRPAPARPDVPALNGPMVEIEPFTGSDEIALLLVTAEELAKAWVPFAEWKTAQGTPTRIITVRQIADAYEGPSIQEQIRRCVRDHIDNRSTRWVMLGGDCTRTGGLVPGGHTTVHAQEPDGIPTDIVYISPTNWDADGDGILGEWTDDRDAIVYPDGSIGLGRVPVRTTEDVRAFTEKVIAFESDYPTDGFAERMVYTCTDSPAYPKVRASWDRHVSTVWDGTVFRFFNTETAWDDAGQPGSHDLSDANLIDLINERQIGRLHIHGHGLVDRWILENSKFDAGSVNALTNDGAYPLMTTVSCFTGEYDASTDPCIVESMLRAPGAGTVAIVAPVRTGKPHFHSRNDYRLMVTEGKLDGTTMTMTRYWAHGLGNELTTGEAFTRAIHDLTPDAQRSASYHLCACELNLLGDPTLDMRASAPTTPSINVADMCELNARSIVVQTNTPGATVCIWKGHEVYEFATADAAGRAELPLSLATPGELRVTVAGPALNTTSKTVRVQASN